MKTHLALFATTALLATTLHANPTGGLVTHGNASFEIDGKNLIIHQGSDKAIIHWDDFSVSLDELTRFIQPSSNAAALNRVTGALPSHIDGALQANGQLVLINPNGILVGPGGRIDTRSFTGSTLGLTDSDFLATGDMTFAGDSDASVINLGTINAVGGDIFLFGRSVENRGTLNAPDGTVGLGAGQEILLKQSGDERVFVQPKGTGKSEKGVDNAGTVAAATAELKAHGNIYALAVNNSGIVRATGAAKKNGRVFLTAPGGKVRNSGAITARNADRSGGSIQVTGDDVTLTTTSKIDASGETAGGQVNVGGGYQGKDPAIANAATTTVGQGSTITADATAGDAGNIVVWADGTTTFAGTISARALGTTGRGGDAEVSGAQHLHYTGSADLRGVAGNYGTLLLDPGSINITNDPSPGTDAIRASTLAADLANANVTIATSNASGAIAPEETVTFESGVNLTWSAPTDLAVAAGRNIVVSPGSSINSSGTGSIIFNANRGPVPTPGSFNGIQVGGRLTSAGGKVVLNGNAGASNGIGVYVVSPITAGTTDSPDTGIFIDGVGGTEFNNPGVLIEEQNSLNATFGKIEVRGRGIAGGVNVDNSQGIKLHDNARIVSSGTGPNAATITLIGEGTPSAGLSDNDGVTLIGESFIRSADGDITISGTGASNSTDRGGGVLIASGTVESTGNGSIFISGEAASSSGTNNNGVRLGFDFSDPSGNGTPQPGFVPPLIATNSGDLEITGTSPAASGILIETHSSVRTQTGNVTLSGRGESVDWEIVAQRGIEIDQGSGSFTFDGFLTAPSLTTSPGDYAIDFRRGADIGSGTIFNNSGGLSINSGPGPNRSFVVFGDISAPDGLTEIAGLVRTPGGSILFGDTQLRFSPVVSNARSPGQPGGITLPPGTDPQIAFGTVSGSSLSIDAGPGTDITIGDLGIGVMLDITNGRNASVASTGRLAVGPVNISGDLDLFATGGINQNGPISAAKLSAQANGGPLLLDHPGNSFSNIFNLFSTGSIDVLSLNRSPLTVTGPVQTPGGDILLVARGGDLILAPAASFESPSDITLATDHNFINLSPGPGVVSPGGRLLVYTASVEGVRLGSLATDATEIGKAFPQRPAALNGDILIALTDEAVTPPGPGDPGTPSLIDRVRDRRNDRPRTPGSDQGNLPPRVVAILERMRQNSPRGSRRPEEDNPVNQIGGAPRILVAQLDSSGSSDPRPPRAVPRPFHGAPFAGALFAAPGSDLPLSPELGPVTFGTGGTFGTSDTTLPEDLLEGLSDEAVKELESSLRNP